MSEHEQTTLTAYFTPKTLTQLGVTGTSLHACLSYASTSFKKGGMHRLWRKLPVIKSLTPVKDNRVQMDLDLSCVVLDAQKNVLDVVWYGRLSDDANSICHDGDALMGAVDFEDSLHHQEQICIYLSDLPSHVHELCFFVSSYHKQDLCLANKGFLKLIDNEHHTLHKHPLSEFAKDTKAVLVWQLIRQSDDFLLKAPLSPVIIKDNAPESFINILKDVAVHA